MLSNFRVRLPTSTTRSTASQGVTEPLLASSFDVVLWGKGLPESVLAAAGKTVLHVYPCLFYGSLYSSILLSSFLSFLSLTLLRLH